ncbi:PPE family protein, SVP subgroup [Mycobacterium vicinigordonae]|uniref:PPE domain-containing protein n=1 Tax=Mycobacterium vicinigordonae TaxID=1719132 RepID=A0A7D6DUX7_9MYCO|nr:PPE domain-containing protein [Mycobacterium vicinigordonae]QLL05307.1 PPE domain-containing protein [Mycobacterium vicinigordonae]
MDFGLLPPEINSALMYAGPGSGSMLGAAAAWDGLSAELYSTASAYQSVISTLTSAPWVGPASASMAGAAAPYVAWLQATAIQAEQTSGQAKAAAVAYETAFAETVPPPVVAANRALLATLVATNFFGQNTPAIALTETQYAEMWAQDSAAMLTYAASSASATTLTPFTEPEPTTSSGGLPAQAAAVAQATSTSAGDAQSAVSSAQQTFAAVPNALTGLASPAAVTDPLVSGLSLLQLLDLVADLSGIFVDPELGLSGLTLDGILAGTALPYDINGYYIGEHTDDIVSGWAGVQSWPGTDPAPPTSFPVINSGVSAGLGEASSVGALSVPEGWTMAAPNVRLAAMALPATSAAAAAEASGVGSVFSQMALAGMAGRAMAGTTGSGGGAGARTRERVGGGVTKRPADAKCEAKDETGPTGDAKGEATAGAASPPPLGGPITSIAAELRELASLRDAGILTDEEFTEQKRRLLPR